MLSPGGIERAASDPEGLKAELAEHLKSINETLDPHEQMDCIVLFKQPWTVDNGLITPTFKVKRNDVDKAFGKQYETWAESRQKVILAD